MSGSSGNLRRIAYDAAELPGIRLLAKPLYARLLERKALAVRNTYYGVYAQFAEAQEHALKSLAHSFDIPECGDIYQDRCDSIASSDYPVIYWLSRLLTPDQPVLFDVGGNIGISYYGFRRYLSYPANLRWRVHDVPAVVAAGRERASRNDAAGMVEFTESPGDAENCDIMLASGVLQYLEFTLVDMLQSLHDPPRHVLVNMTPLHPERSFFTLQVIGRQKKMIACCPYRVTMAAQFIAAVQSCGYSVIDRWEIERRLHIPFEAACSIDCYHGFYFRHD